MQKSLIVALSEIAKSISNEAIPISPIQHRQLAPHTKRLRALVSPNNLRREKKVLQTCGYLGFLLEPLLSLGKSILGPLLGGLQVTKLY